MLGSSGFFESETLDMNKTTVLLTLSALAMAGQLAAAGDITGTITLKGTPPKEKDITDDPFLRGRVGRRARRCGCVRRGYQR